jgi:hypothetical protein
MLPTGARIAKPLARHVSTRFSAEKSREPKPFSPADPCELAPLELAPYRHLCNAPGGADDRFAAVVMRSSRRLTR